MTGSVSPAAEAGVFVLGMHRSGTSAVTRLVSLLGLATPPAEDLVGPTDKNPKGYWESEALVNFNERVLAAVGCHMSCPIWLEKGWESDSRLDDLRRAAPDAVRAIFPTTPWVWKDPRHCLSFGFWESVLPVRPVVLLVNRNPLEITASTLRVRSDQGKVYALALWERYVRQALRQIGGLPVLVTNYEDVLAAPLDWCASAAAFLSDAGVPIRRSDKSEVLEFIDNDLRHNRFTEADLDRDPDVSVPQRALFAALKSAAGHQHEFSAPSLSAETPTTEALLAERRKALQIRRELTVELEQRSQWGPRFRRRLTRVRPVGVVSDEREPVHVLHIGKTGGTALSQVLVEHAAAARYRPVFGGHKLTLANVPAGERFLFFIRDPLTRFVSAFNSRLQQDRPHYHYPWREEEKIAFANFATPDELGAALSAVDPVRRARAEAAMQGIGHLNTFYTFWFGDAEAFRARLDDAFFIGFQDRLDDDFELLKRRLGLPPQAMLPRGVAAHQAPAGSRKTLGQTARANLERWYADDLAFVQLCRELAPRVNAVTA